MPTVPAQATWGARAKSYPNVLHAPSGHFSLFKKAVGLAGIQEIHPSPGTHPMADLSDHNHRACPCLCLISCSYSKDPCARKSFSVFHSVPLLQAQAQLLLPLSSVV